MNRKAALVVTAVFLLGFLLGGLLDHVAGDRVWGSTLEKKPSGARGRGERPNVVEELTQELKLTPEQRQQFEVILDESRKSFQAVNEEVRPRIQEIRERGRNRIRAILTPEQLPAYEAFVTRIDEERKKRNRH